MSAPAEGVTIPYYTGSLSTAFRLLGGHARSIWLGIGLRFVQAMCAGVPVAMLVWVVRQLRIDALSARDAWLATIVTIGAIALQYVVWYTSNRITWVHTYQAIAEARARALAHVNQLALGTLRSRSTGDVTSVFSTDFEAVSTYISNALPALIGAIGLPLVVLAAMLRLDPPLAASVAVSLVVGGPLFVCRHLGRLSIGELIHRRL